MKKKITYPKWLPKVLLILLLGWILFQIMVLREDVDAVHENGHYYYTSDDRVRDGRIKELEKKVEALDDKLLFLNYTKTECEKGNPDFVEVMVPSKCIEFADIKYTMESEEFKINGTVEQGGTINTTDGWSIIVKSSCTDCQCTKWNYTTICGKREDYTFREEDEVPTNPRK